MKKQIILGFLGTLSFTAIYATTVLCPEYIACQSKKTSSCAPTSSDSNVKWSVDPGATSSPVVPAKYFLISASRDKTMTPGSCVYMVTGAQSKSSFVAMVSSKNLIPLQNQQTDWRFKSPNWSCPKNITYKKINPSTCAFKTN